MGASQGWLSSHKSRVIEHDSLRISIIKLIVSDIFGGWTQRLPECRMHCETPGPVSPAREQEERIRVTSLAPLAGEGARRAGEGED